MTPKTKQEIDKCKALINEAQHMNLHIPRMLEIEAKLSTRYVYLSQESAKAQADLNNKYWVRKIGYSAAQIEARKAGAKSDAMAQNLGLKSIKAEIEAECQANQDFEILKAFCKGIDKVLISLTHRIKWAESEMIIAGKGG